MAQIGTFTHKDGTWTGTIRTMTINVKAQLVPNKSKANEDAPDYRLYAGGAELGAAWRQDSKDGKTSYFSVKLDDPSFSAPVRAAFFGDEGAGTGTMVWKRQA
tara:strand:+ start:462 stop:770 length:309 start_codon:yes stop_codon:yes gene_type:complete